MHYPQPLRVKIYHAILVELKLAINLDTPIYLYKKNS